MNKKKKLQLFIVLAVLGIFFVNLTLISGYLIITHYGEMELNPGEHYIVNIPFNLFKEPVVSGTALASNGTPINGINVTIRDSDEKIIGSDITKSDGTYIITLPKISDLTEYSVDVGYDNESSQFEDLVSGSNDYNPDFESHITYSRSSDSLVRLTGEISNKDAEVENGKIKVTLSSCEENTTSCNELLETKNYYVNILPHENYLVPNNEEFDFSWTITGSTDLGRYEIFVETSFNGQPHTRTIYFYIVN